VRIDQVLPDFAAHDAIGNHVQQARQVLRQAGYQSDVWAERIDPRLAAEARPYGQRRSRPGDVLIFHQSTDAPDMAEWLKATATGGTRLVFNYHNITPAGYFARWEPAIATRQLRARQQLVDLASVASLSIAVSEYNRRELVAAGYQQTAVCPLLLDLDPYAPAAQRPGPRTTGGRWLFVGRLAPNKCQHDVIAAFAVYRRCHDPAARLTLIGNPSSPSYLQAMLHLVDSLGLGEAVAWRADVAFGDLLRAYRDADVLVCLSEHEGFCVPLVEAMALGLPVVAFRAGAVADTVGDGGRVIETKEPTAVAAAVASVLGDATGWARLAAAGQARSEAFRGPVVAERFLGILDGWLHKGVVA
jgi:glycosyltransferase involved in cell wall biosynthesis